MARLTIGPDPRLRDKYPQGTNQGKGLDQDDVKRLQNGSKKKKKKTWTYNNF